MIFSTLTWLQGQTPPLCIHYPCDYSLNSIQYTPHPPAAPTQQWYPATVLEATLIFLYVYPITIHEEFWYLLTQLLEVREIKLSPQVWSSITSLKLTNLLYFDSVLSQYDNCHHFDLVAPNLLGALWPSWSYPPGCCWSLSSSLLCFDILFHRATLRNGLGQLLPMD